MNNRIYRSISEVSELLQLNKHVIRYWDSKFEGVSTRLNHKKRRYFNSQNIKKLQTLKKLLHTNGKSHYSLEMAKNILNRTQIKNPPGPVRINNEKPLIIKKLSIISNNLKNLIK